MLDLQKLNSLNWIGTGSWMANIWKEASRGSKFQRSTSRNISGRTACNWTDCARISALCPESFVPSFDIQKTQMLHSPVSSNNFAPSFTRRIYGYETWSVTQVEGIWQQNMAEGAWSWKLGRNRKLGKRIYFIFMLPFVVIYLFLTPNQTY